MVESLLNNAGAWYQVACTVDRKVGIIYGNVETDLVWQSPSCLSQNAYCFSFADKCRRTRQAGINPSSLPLKWVWATLMVLSPPWGSFTYSIKCLDEAITAANICSYLIRITLERMLFELMPSVAEGVHEAWTPFRKILVCSELVSVESRFGPRQVSWIALQSCSKVKPSKSKPHALLSYVIIWIVVDAVLYSTEGEIKCYCPRLSSNKDINAELSEFMCTYFEVTNLKLVVQLLNCQNRYFSGWASGAPLDYSSQMWTDTVDTWPARV